MVFRKPIVHSDWNRKSFPTRMRSRRCVSPVFPVVVTVLLATPLVGVSSAWQGAGGSASSSASVSATSQACVYEGHLLTDKNWYGYLANITVMTTGRLTFEFIYPADKCCQNVLFYSDDQMAIINARMNCWQKEYPLRPEDDQILRLTPRFSWSGCHMTHPNNVATYVCKGGRSFAVEHQRQQYGHGQHPPHHDPRQQQQQQPRWSQYRRGDDRTAAGGYSYGTWGGSGGRSVHAGTRPTTWYIALSNCASLHGLELRYRMEVYGHVGECRAGMPAHFDYYRPDLPSFGSVPSPRPVISAPDRDESDVPAAVAGSDADLTATCVVEGDINTTETWYQIANASLTASALTDDASDWTGFRFEFSFPQSLPMLYMVIYGEAEQSRLPEDESCWHKHSVIPAQKVHDRILEFSPRYHFNGCSVKNTTKYGLSIVCSGRRRFTAGPAGPTAGSERQILVAVDNCRAKQLVATYRVQMDGFACNAAAAVAPLPRWLPTIHRNLIPVARAIIWTVFAQSFLCLVGSVAFMSLTISRMAPS